MAITDLQGITNAELLDAYTYPRFTASQKRTMRDELLRRLSAGNPQAAGAPSSADLTSSQRAWVEGKAGWEGISIAQALAQYSIPIPEHLNEDGTARRCKDCRDDRAAWDHSTVPEPERSDGRIEASTE